MKPRNVSKLTVIDDVTPETTVLTFLGSPLISGKGDMDLVCGGCDALLIHGQTATDVAMQYKVLKLVIKCQCGSYNTLSTDAAGHPKFDVQRDKLIAEAAYYRAEKRGFAPGYALEDWLWAEAQVDFEIATRQL